MSTVLVTGCNRGIGLELVRQLQQRGDAVIAVCREAGAALRATGARIVDGIDVAVGWLTSPAPTTPTGGAPGFVVRALGDRNGELGVVSAGDVGGLVEGEAQLGGSLLGDAPRRRFGES